MRLYVKTAAVSTCTIPHLGERAYLQLDVEMTDRQIYEAVVLLLGSMRSPEHAREMLVSEFPELLDAQEQA